MINTSRLNGKDQIEKIGQYLVNSKQMLKSSGLFHGQMGLSIFFYHLYKSTGDKNNEKMADELLDQVYGNLTSSLYPIDFENGLAGIGFGIEYLVQNGFVDANTDDVLADVDDKIFHHIVHSEELTLGIRSGLLGYASYVLIRLRNCNDAETRFLTERLLIEIFNKIDKAIGEEIAHFDEPSGFNLLWDFPILLLLIGETLRLNIYRAKILRILDTIEPMLCSQMPLLHCNRAFLLLGINTVLENATLPNWERHAVLIAENICLETILNKEFSDKNVLMQNGLSGILPVVSKVARTFQSIEKQFNPKTWIDRIERSTLWDDVLLNEKINPRSLGFLNGLTGIGYLLLMHKPQKEFAL